MKKLVADVESDATGRIGRQKQMIQVKLTLLKPLAAVDSFINYINSNVLTLISSIFKSNMSPYFVRVATSLVGCGNCSDGETALLSWRSAP